MSTGLLSEGFSGPDRPALEGEIVRGPRAADAENRGGNAAAGSSSAALTREQLRAGWLLAAKSDNTREARARDLGTWVTFLSGLPGPHGEDGIDVFAATGDTVNSWMRSMEKVGLAPATVARKVASVSSFYTYLIAQKVMADGSNPARSAVVNRPEIDGQHSETTGLTAEEARRVIRVAFEREQVAATRRSRIAARRDATVIAVMLSSGLRVSEVCRARIEHLGYDRGHRVIFVVRKGGKRQSVVLGAAAEPVDAWLAELGAPAAGWLFGTNRGTPLARGHVFRVLRSIAADAKLPGAAGVSPHALRHTFATLAFDEGAALADVQDAMGHRDPQTTRRYDRARGRVDRSPSIVVSKLLLGDMPEVPSNPVRTV